MLLSNVYEDFLFDGTNFQLSGVLHKILSTEIARTVTNKINFKSPDLERLQDIRDQKQSLVKLLEYYVEKISKHIEQNQKLLTWTQTLAVLDKVVSILDVLTFFVRIKDQSSLLDEVFNNASMKDIEATRMNNDSISVLKQRLLAICEFVLDLPAVEDPFDPSAHTTSENLQLRFLFGAARLCLMNPTYYKQFGAWIICIWHGSKAESKEAPMSVRRTEVIRNIMGKLLKEHHDKFEEILFESTKMIMNNEKISTELRTHHLDKLCQSVFMLKGFKKDRKYWIKFTKLFLNYTVGVAENIPNYFSYLHALTYLFRHLTNRDKLDIWKHFRSLSRKLPDQELRTDESKWALYQQFRSKLKAEAQRASQHRQLELDDDAIENLDLTQSQTQIHSQSQMVPLSQHDINIGVHIEDDDDHVVPERNRDADVGVDDNKQNGADEEKKEDDAGEEDEVSAPLRRLSISKESPAKKKKKTNERVSVGVSRSRRDDDDADGDEEEEEVEQESEIESEDDGEADNHNRRVSVSKPSRNRRKNGNHDEEEEEEEEDDDLSVDVNHHHKAMASMDGVKSEQDVVVCQQNNVQSIFSLSNRYSNQGVGGGFGQKQISNGLFGAYREMKARQDSATNNNPFSNNGRKRNYRQISQGSDGRGGVKTFLTDSTNYHKNVNNNNKNHNQVKHKRRRVVKTSTTANHGHLPSKTNITKYFQKHR
mmetsp:Transcript_71447/g.113640  ORF Transcript_71447/g.113640 Transcript_71447/m.113640 type:complete len:707 (-) Transcript_71447:134-2254(-)